MSPAEEIKSKLDIVDILSEYISLQPAGSNLRAVCPFHQEKSPSFMISPEKQIWHCFGCGQGGDLISFVKEIEGLSFPETLRLLAPKAGVVLKKNTGELSSKRNRLLDVVEAAQEFYQREMLKSDKIKNYLKGRGLDEKAVKLWRIGYGPESWDDLLIFLKQKGYREEEIFLAGLSAKNPSGKSYNRFRDRIMFPLSDVTGNAVGFTGRINPDNKDESMQKMGKYINSPQTEIYDKSKILFGLDKAKQAIKMKDLAIVTEGQMDVIACHQFGYNNTVAASGTALTEEQVKLIKRYTNNIALAFDADSAGQMAADRGVKEALAQEMNVKIIMIPSGKDPDDCLRNNPTEWETAVNNAKPMMEFYFDKIFAGIDNNNVDNKRLAANKFLNLIVGLSNKVEVDHWIKRLGERIDVQEDLLRETFKKMINEAKPDRNKPEAPKIASTAEIEGREERLSALLLALIIKFPELIEYALHKIELYYIVGAKYRLFYNNLIIYYNDTKAIEYDKFKAYLQIKEVGQVNLLDTLYLLADKDFFEFGIDAVKAEMINIILELRKSYYKKKMQDLEKLIREAERNKSDELVLKLMKEMQDCALKIKNIN